MTFRNPNPTPTALLISPGGQCTECLLTALHADHLTAHVPDASSLPTVGDLRLALAPPEGPGPAGVPVAIRLHDPEERVYTLTMDQPAAIWHAANTVQNHNRRQAFRVTTLPGTGRDLESQTDLLASLQLGHRRFACTVVDLSLTGCGVILTDHTPEDLPAEGSLALFTLEGLDFPEPLRLPARIQTTRTERAGPRLGLAFQTRENPLWLRVEQQIQGYVLRKQREQIRFRAG